MKIKKLNIKNFRGIDDLDLEFTSDNGTPLDLVVLAGPNGSGKTSILEACLLALDYKNLPGKKSESKGNKRLAKNGVEISVTLDIDGQPLQSSYLNGSISCKAIEAGTIQKQKEYFSSWRAPKLVGSVSVATGRKGRKPPTTEDNRLMLIKQYLVNLKALKAFETKNAVFSEEELFGKINKVWKLFYPEQNDTFEAQHAGEAVEEGFDLFLVDSSRQYNIPIDALSSGEIEVFTMLGWFAIHDYSGGIIFIDEPELHLHPAWQRIIIKALQEILPNTQLIISTHSPQVLSCIQPESIWLLKRIGGRIQVTRPEGAYGLDSNRILEDLLDAPERPIEIKTQIQELFNVIDKGELGKARISLNQLREKIGVDPELVKAETLIFMKETIGK